MDKTADSDCSRSRGTAAVDPAMQRRGQVEPTPPQSDLFKSQTPTAEFTWVSPHPVRAVCLLSNTFTPNTLSNRNAYTEHASDALRSSPQLEDGPYDIVAIKANIGGSLD